MRTKKYKIITDDQRKRIGEVLYKTDTGFCYSILENGKWVTDRRFGVTRSLELTLISRMAKWGGSCIYLYDSSFTKRYSIPMEMKGRGVQEIISILMEN